MEKPKLREQIKFQTKIEDGHIKETNYSIFMLSKYAPAPVYISVEPVNRRRTLSQNAYYWAVVIPALSEKTGYAPGQLDRLLEQEFCPREVIVWRGIEKVTIKHCKDLTVGEMTEFLTNVIAEAQSMGVEIEPPNFDHQLK